MVWKGWCLTRTSAFGAEFPARTEFPPPVTGVSAPPLSRDQHFHQDDEAEPEAYDRDSQICQDEDKNYDLVKWLSFYRADTRLSEKIPPQFSWPILCQPILGGTHWSLCSVWGFHMKEWICTRVWATYYWIAGDGWVMSPSCGLDESTWRRPFYLGIFSWYLAMLRLCYCQIFVCAKISLGNQSPTSTLDTF